MSKSSILQESLSDSETRALICKAKQGDMDARERVILAYLPLAESYAAKYQNLGVPFEDLYQEACYGLIVSLLHYDPSRKEVFATLASHYIRKYIRDNALTKQNYTIPSCYNRDFYYEIKSFLAIKEKYIAEHGEEPTDSELSQLLNFSLFRIRRLKMAASAFLTPSSEYDYENENYSVDTTSRPVEDEVLSRESCLNIVNSPLTTKEREVLERRCGFTEDGIPQPWAQISAEMGLSIKWLQKLHQTAIIKLRKAVSEDPDLL